MDKDKILRAKNTISGIAGKSWEPLADAAIDSIFLSTLKNQEKNLIQSLLDNPNQINPQREYYADILSKYYAWMAYTKSGHVRLNELNKEINISQTSLDNIKKVASYIGGATTLVSYSKDFKATSDNHGNEAKKLKRWYIASIFCTALLICLVFFINISDFSILKKIIAEDLTGSKTKYIFIGALILKSFALFSVYQISVFFKKNYSAEKHLQEVYQHRSDVLQSLHAVYEAITDTTERDRILSAAALFAYERGETGYITTREGAGGDNDMMSSIFSRILNTK